MDEIEKASNHGDDVVSVVEQPEGHYLTGYRLWFAGLGLALSIFLPALEVTIVSTSLISITDVFHEYDQVSWIITAYLVTYQGFLVVWSKLCKMFGLKPTLLISMLIFIGFSAGCGAAQSMDQLIIFRAFQGVGGSGVYSITTIGFIQMVPGELYSQITAVASSLMSLGMILGPLLGGVINNAHQWRWVFYLNVPAGVIGLAICLLTFPNGFPNHGTDSKSEKKESIVVKLFKKPDTLGAFLLVGASIILVVPLQEGGVRFSWSSATTISLFIVSGLLWIAFVLWECYASRPASEVDPMFPKRFFGNRAWLGALFGCFLSGAPITIAIIDLPQRYQIVNGNSPLGAGVKLLAYAVTTPIGVVAASAATGRFRIPFVYTMFIGCVLQVTGFALLSTLPTYEATWNGVYGYSVIAGLGTGVAIGSLYMLAPIAVEKKDQALAVGLGLQFRMLGGALGIAAVNTVLTSYLTSHLPSILQGPQLAAVQKTAEAIILLPPDVQEEVRAVYGKAYNLQMRVTIAFSGSILLSILLIWKRKQLSMGKNGRLE